MILFIRISPAIYLNFMDSIVLDVQTRDKSIKAKDLLANNLLPIEYYGKGVENQSFQVDYQTFRRLFKKAGSNTIIELNTGAGKPLLVLVHDVSYHPATDRFTHVDVINVRMGEKLHTKVPLEFVGMAPAVKELGGVFTAHMHEIEVECLPKDLIHSIEVDISSIVDFHSYVRVQDLVVPSTVVILHEPEDVVANVSAPKVEVEAPIEESSDSAESAESGEAAAE